MEICFHRSLDLDCRRAELSVKFSTILDVVSTRRDACDSRVYS